ncbi:MAG: hypothetical protein ABI947_15330 [Chloroflexota bacterium]
MSPEELEAKIRAKMDEEITGLVGQYQASQRKTLDEIEATAVGLGQHVREIALQEMLAAHAECSITNSLKMAYRLVLPLSKVPSNHSKVD